MYIIMKTVYIYLLGCVGPPDTEELSSHAQCTEPSDHRPTLVSDITIEHAYLAWVERGKDVHLSLSLCPVLFRTQPLL